MLGQDKDNGSRALGIVLEFCQVKIPRFSSAGPLSPSTRQGCTIEDPSRARSNPKNQTEHQTEEEIEGGESIVESLNPTTLLYVHFWCCSASLM